MFSYIWCLEYDVSVIKITYLPYKHYYDLYEKHEVHHAFSSLPSFIFFYINEWLYLKMIIISILSPGLTWHDFSWHRWTSPGVLEMGKEGCPRGKNIKIGLWKALKWFQGVWLLLYCAGKWHNQVCLKENCIFTVEDRLMYKYLRHAKQLRAYMGSIIVKHNK